LKIWSWTKKTSPSWFESLLSCSWGDAPGGFCRGRWFLAASPFLLGDGVERSRLSRGSFSFFLDGRFVIPVEPFYSSCLRVTVRGVDAFPRCVGRPGRAWSASWELRLREGSSFERGGVSFCRFFSVQAYIFSPSLRSLPFSPLLSFPGMTNYSLGRPSSFYRSRAKPFSSFRLGLFFPAITNAFLLCSDPFLEVPSPTLFFTGPFAPLTSPPFPPRRTFTTAGPLSSPSLKTGLSDPACARQSPPTA